MADELVKNISIPMLTVRSNSPQLLRSKITVESHSECPVPTLELGLFQACYLSITRYGELSYPQAGS